ncbi:MULTISPECIES: DNA ligase D [Stenotrophomonas]|uniref:DNA ligase (ATP) n=1 Tax=Stenotrophomonas lactitubi TaxID=2045214 RepID=A0AAW4GIC7_9GAMM|nr:MULTISPECIES: DNA ligase D [Stenotrophomonas]MBM9913626.1 DNA ligase D [Stenotrophomonas lactitubi]MBM9921442.1 DNA ligase D [Stenotrophomonas lactitubi]MBM9938594.1 DNA ligase D [Stenotrophomonas lactitubi]
MSLHQYRRKRRLGGGSGQTPEPDEAPARGNPKRRPIFVVQLHHASSRHYDFRLEMDGVLKSWAVPKGPSLRVGEKRLAVEVEDHPLSYAGFEGDIPEGHYGAGHVDVFDHGSWACEGDPLQALAAGKIDFVLHGQRLAGSWKLVRTAMKGRQVQWLLIKRDDEQARDAEADDLLHAPPRKPAKTNRASTKKAAPAPRTAHPRKADARWHARALKLDGARDKSYPRQFKPQLTDHRDTAPDGERWLHEIKWDGYRLLADLHEGEVKLRSRNGLDWTADFPEVVQAVQALPVRDARLDGELVVLDDNGRSDFAALQRVIDGSSKQPLRYIVFDLPGVAGVDISRAPLLERKALLKALIGDTPGTLAFSEHVIDHGPAVFEASGKAGFEGIVSKQVDAPYVNTRARSWVKVKHEDTDEFLIIGHTAPKGSRVGFGSLLLATPDKGGLRYVGRVGTGFDDESLRALSAALAPLAVKAAVLELPSHVPFRAASVRWVKPVTVAEVAFRGWGKEGLLRQASFKRLRSDKQKEDLAMSEAPADDGDDVAITHPERVVFAKKKLSKGDVADYYRQMARWILPEISGRPLSLLRCPDGVGKACFFQKHHGQGLGDAVHAVPLQQKSGREDYVYIDDERGLLQLVQMNTLELHPWGATVADPEHPDRLVFDLDPGEGVSWADVKRGARDVRDRLQETGLRSFVRLSGGKGVHVVVPLLPKADWEDAKAFCEAFAQAMAEQAPDRYVATMSKAKRSGVIFIDWLRNTRGATSVCSWSLRARESAGVAVPLRWEELARVGAADAFPMDKALARAKRLKADPWQGIDALKQTLPTSKR